MNALIHTADPAPSADAISPCPRTHFSSLGLLGFVLILVAVVQVATTIGTLGTPQVYRKDLLQDYLAARAILDGQDPYRPMSALRAEYLGDVETALAFPHPTPHPPPALLLTSPLGLTSYPRAAACWLVVEYVLLGASVVLIARRAWRTTRIAAPLALAGLALWTCPVRDDLVLGQFSVVILALFVASYFALDARRPLRAGLFLGAAVSLKFLGWPLVLFFAWKRRWGVVAGAVAVLLLAHVVAAWVMPGAIARYYTVVAPHAGADYSASDLNISVWTLGQRLFGGLYSQATTNHVVAPPLIARPALAQRTGAILALATLLLSLRAATRLRDEASGFLVMLAVSTVLNPIAWEIYLTLLVLPMAVVGCRLAERSWPPRLTAALVGLVVLLAALKLPREWLFGDETELAASTALALVTALPLLYPLAVGWLVVRSSNPTPGSNA